MTTEALVKEFLEIYQDKIIQMAITYRQENGIGALIVKLLGGNTEEIDVEYYKLDDLDENFQGKILSNPRRDSTIYYIIELTKTSLIFEHNLDTN